MRRRAVPQPPCRRGLAPVFAAAGLALWLHAGIAAAQTGLGVSPIFDYAQSGNTGAVDYLLKKGESIDRVNAGGETVLTIAAANGHPELVDLAIAKGARVNHEDDYGRSALSWAAARGHDAAAARLIEHGADIDHQTREGMTPVMLAVRAGNIHTVQLLLRHDPDLTLRDYTGRSALGWARNGRDRRIEEMLRRAGAEQGG